jgi:hypothetical protein
MADEKFFRFEKLTPEEAARLMARERPTFHYWRLGYIGLDLRPTPEGKGKTMSFHFGEGAIRHH